MSLLSVKKLYISETSCFIWFMPSSFSHGYCTTTMRQPQSPYSPDLPPSDFYLFPKLKSPMKGRRFDKIRGDKERIAGGALSYFKKWLSEMLWELELTEVYCGGLRNSLFASVTATAAIQNAVIISLSNFAISTRNHPQTSNSSVVKYFHDWY